MNEFNDIANAASSGGDMTGFSSPDEPGLCAPVPIRRPLSLAWVSDELIAETRRLWSARYGREISVDEAIEILQNVKRFAEMLMERSEE
ncbi:hypothetical protein SH661x_004394 [Planctomicrobium sp. SH661]|uniref:hypothetical protein n=1 Tax=Planctomicrobium sp. SH661 TaxID=3448124 RepID=UPI003F5B3928